MKNLHALPRGALLLSPALSAQPSHFAMAQRETAMQEEMSLREESQRLCKLSELKGMSINNRMIEDGETKLNKVADFADLIFDVPTLISFLSSITTLVTGDIIFTGTPEGVGAAPGKYLADGDVITTTIEGIGTMTNRVVRISDARPIRG